jgi:cytochrome c oxidase subunit IV
MMLLRFFYQSPITSRATGDQRKPKKLLAKVYKTLFLASEIPYMFKAFTLSDNIRVGLISKQTSFFYRVQENEIIILLFWDNRQEPMFTG